MKSKLTITAAIAATLIGTDAIADSAEIVIGTPQAPNMTITITAGDNTTQCSVTTSSYSGNAIGPKGCNYQLVVEHDAYRNSSAKPGESNPGCSIVCNQTQTTPQASMLQSNGMCLDAHGPDAKRNGGRVQIWECHGGWNQSWQFIGNQIRSDSGLCLDAHGPDSTRNGGRVQMWECGVNNPNQHWRWHGNQLMNGMGLCLDVGWDTRLQNGGGVQVWDCGVNNTNQHWAKG